MGKLQQHPVGIQNILDYQKSPGINLLISGRLGPIPGGLSTLIVTKVSYFSKPKDKFKIILITYCASTNVII